MRTLSRRCIWVTPSYRSAACSGRHRAFPPHPGRHPATLLPWVAMTLSFLLLAAVLVFAAALHLRPIDALYFVVTTATTTGYGDISLHDAPAWLKLFGCM